MFAREIVPGDGVNAATLWSDYLPPDKHRLNWLPSMINQGIEDGIFRGAIVERDGQTIAFGLSCFLSDAVAKKYESNPKPYLNDRLMRRLFDGDHTCLLDRRAQAEANRGDGLELFILEACGDKRSGSRIFDSQLINTLVPIYHQAHIGFNIRRHMHETERCFADVQIAGGNQELFSFSEQHPHSLSPEGMGPRSVYGLSRDLINQGNITGHANIILNYIPPTLKLLPREQQIILMALQGFTDQEIGARAQISRDAVKQHWQAIYAHIEERVPLVFKHQLPQPPAGVRGREKRRRVLAYVSVRPSELRPHYSSRTQN